jgi:hypothetical protein
LLWRLPVRTRVYPKRHAIRILRTALDRPVFAPLMDFLTSLEQL